MGTGANVQDKLVALHNLDVPWKPSDLEQRAGRIIRQGNTNEKVKIFRYVTEETFDAYSYQLIESKQRFISQVMTSKSPARVASDIDEQALSYAEVKALATGDPRIKEKMDLDTDVQKLRLLKSSYLNEKYNLEDAIAKSLPQEINRFETIAKGAALDMEVAKQNPKQDEDGNFIGIYIQGTKFTDKEKAGEILLGFTKRYIDSPIDIGEYRGFKLSMDFDSLTRDFTLRLKNELSYTAYLGMDNITRLDNAINKIGERLEKANNEIANLKGQLASAKKTVSQPFEREEELAEKEKRLEYLNYILSDSVQKKNNQTDDSESAGNNNSKGGSIRR